MKSVLKFFAEFLIVFILFLTFTSKPVASSIVISNIPSEINHNQEVSVDLFLSCAGCGDSYMRGVFYPSGTNYFGYTQNNLGNWIGTNSDRSLYFAINKTDLIDASWSGKLKIKPDITDPAYTGSGEYLFKVGRYTSSTDSSADWSNELSIRIIGPTPSPTQAPTTAPTNSPTQIPTKSPSPVPTKTATPKPTPTEKAVIESNNVNLESKVLGDSDVNNITPEPTSAGSVTSGNKPRVMAFMLFISGSLFLGYGGFLLYNQRHGKN